MTMEMIIDDIGNDNDDNDDDNDDDDDDDDDDNDDNDDNETDNGRPPLLVTPAKPKLSLVLSISQWSAGCYMHCAELYLYLYLYSICICFYICINIYISVHGKA